MSRPYRVLFVCIGNSCRSQMAEGFAHHYYPELIAPSSAGLFPAAVIQPDTITCMGELGVSLENQQPKKLEETDWKTADLLINMSGEAVLGRIPSFDGLNLVWNVKDPIGQSMETYREVRDKIEVLLDQLADNLRRQGLPSD